MHDCNPLDRRVTLPAAPNHQPEMCTHDRVCPGEQIAPVVGKVSCMMIRWCEGWYISPTELLHSRSQLPLCPVNRKFSNTGLFEVSNILFEFFFEFLQCMSLRKSPDNIFLFERSKTIFQRASFFRGKVRQEY